VSIVYNSRSRIDQFIFPNYTCNVTIISNYTYLGTIIDFINEEYKEVK
jgi:hypothetical protein